MPCYTNTIHGFHTKRCGYLAIPAPVETKLPELTDRQKALLREWRENRRYTYIKTGYTYPQVALTAIKK
jgi:hypothetical protein